MNKWIYLGTCVLVFLLGYLVKDKFTPALDNKIAIVDVNMILDNSSEMKNLTKQQERENEELNNLISKAQNELLNEHDKSILLQKEANYRTQIEVKKKSIEDDYATKLSKITSNIKSIVTTEAKQSKYDIVLPANIVISGGDDITQSVIKKIK